MAAAHEHSEEQGLGGVVDQHLRVEQNVVLVRHRPVQTPLLNIATRGVAAQPPAFPIMPPAPADSRSPKTPRGCVACPPGFVRLGGWH